ncbi:unnamed protein product (macronuclear) [Paramecium tetraurelia]|uniref:Uncharacterized protein n=1 Tax=Paramecium tetraurelia TaxID=5888 RepID=A0E7L8_PARTE|nr:uncharacterized protein GSPATT00024013001 [Paramecium tetraurelia]CAK91285.1 unnamed protein product [Paramecium tetraurelia]|eukprot:XP_001458682.1 hypothetical protein (macronuclear) [Paramecium tetraurelia strain d4-2]
MSQSFEMDEKAKLLVKLLDGVKIELQKINQNTRVGKAKILTYNKGYIQYMNKDEFMAIQKAQATSRLTKEEYIYNQGYFVYKAGVNINAIKNGENQIEFGWKNNQETVYYFIFRFKLKQKIIYNPSPEVQNKQKKKREKSSIKDVTWYFEVELQSEIAKLQKRFQEIEDYNERLKKLKVCDSFAYQFDQMEIKIYDSKTLSDNLIAFKIDIEFLGYISNKLENNTNRNIVTAEIAARSLFLYISNLNEYKSNKMRMIEEMLQALYKDKQRNFNQEVIQFAKSRFESNLEAQNFVISDVLFLNALMYNFEFTINLDVKNLLDYQSFFSSLQFNTLENKENDIIKFSTNEVPNEMQQMNYKNFKIFSQKQQNFSDISKYCIGLFGMENQFLGKIYLKLYKKGNEKKNLDYAISFLERNLKNSHSLLKDAYALSKKQESIQKSIHQSSQQMNIKNSQHIVSPPQQINDQQSTTKSDAQNSFKETKKTIKIIECNPQNDNQHDHTIKSNSNQQQISIEQIQIINVSNPAVKQLQQEGQYIKFDESDKSNSTAVSESYQKADKLSYQIAEENYEKGQYISALSAIDAISNKTKMVLRLGFQIEKKLSDSQNQYYSDRLLKNYLIYGCGVQDFQDIQEILQLQFKQYIYDEKISFQSESWKFIITQLKSRKFSKEKVQIVDSIVAEIRYYKYDNIRTYFKSLIEKLKDFPQDQMVNYYDQFQLISKIYQSSQTH